MLPGCAAAAGSSSAALCGATWSRPPRNRHADWLPCRACLTLELQQRCPPSDFIFGIIAERVDIRHSYASVGLGQALNVQHELAAMASAAVGTELSSADGPQQQLAA